MKLDGTTASPTVTEFKLKIKGTTSAVDVKKGSVSSVLVDVPETIVTALAGTEFEEKIKDGPEVLLGHTEAEYERPSDAAVEGVDMLNLLDGANDELKERKGPCAVRH